MMKFIFWILLLMSIAFGLYYLGLGALMCEPNAEDFALSIAPRDHGLVSSVINLLTFFDSRYTANVLHGINILVINRFDLFYLMPLSCLVLLMGAIYFFLCTIFITKGNKSVLLTYAVLLTVFFYSVLPSMPFGLYYMASTFTYIYPIIFWFIYVGCLWKSVNTKGWKYVPITLLGLLSIFASFGCTELFIPINIFTLLIIGFLFFKVRKGLLVNVLPYIVIALASIFFILYCPSNKFTENRVFGDSARYQNTNFIIVSLRQYGQILSHALLNSSSFLFLLSFVIITKPLKIDNRNLVFPSRVNFWVIFIAYQLLIYIVTWVYFVPRGSINDFPLYVFNVILIFCLLGIVLSISMSNIFQLSIFDNLGGHIVHVFIALALVLSLYFGSNNFTLIRSDYAKGLLSEVKRKHKRFYDSVELSKKRHIQPRVVYFQNPDMPPTSNFTSIDVMPNRSAESWNLAYENYFDVDEVRLMGDTIFK